VRRSDLALAARLAASALVLLMLLAAPALFAYAFANRLAAAVAAAVSLAAGRGWRWLACALYLSLPASFIAALREGLPLWLAFALASAVAYLVLWAQAVTLAVAGAFLLLASGAAGYLKALEAAKLLGLVESEAAEEGGRR
jgi:hypothetical protein